MSTVEFPFPDWRESTITGFPAIGDAEVLEGRLACRCGMPGCPDGAPLDPAGAEAVLSYAPGVTSRMYYTRISNGQWTDTESLWDNAHASVHQPAMKQQRRIHADIAARRRDIGAMLSRTPALHSDPDLADGLHQMEAAEPQRLAETQDWVARRAADIRRQEEAAKEAAA